MSKVVVRLIFMVGLAALVAMGWFALSQTGLPLPAPRGVGDGRLYLGGPLSDLQSMLGRAGADGGEPSRTAPVALFSLGVGVGDNLIKMVAATALLAAGWQGLRWLGRRRSPGR